MLCETLSSQAPGTTEAPEPRYVSTNYDTYVTIRVSFEIANERDCPKTAIENGREQAMRLMGWFDATPINEEIHFWKSAHGLMTADVIYTERPVTKRNLPRGAVQA